MDVLIHVANVLFLLSYSVRDILALRLLTVVAIVSLLPYYADNELYPPIWWNSLFVAINLYQLYRLLLERRPVTLTLEQQRLYRLGFDRLSARDFLRLLQQARWESCASETVLVEQGGTLDRLTVLAVGAARVEVGGRIVSGLGPGQFVGEMSYISGEPACARVLASAGSRCVHWPRTDLERLLGDRPDLRAALQGIIGTDLASKLRRGAAAPEPAQAG
jgi:hypothetical protein